MKQRQEFLLVALAVGLALRAGAQDALTPMQIARETSDPTSDLWYLFTEFALTQNPAKPFDQSNQFTFELQPTMPVPLTHGLRLLNFPDLVLGTQGTADGMQITGVKSFSWLSAFSPVSESHFGWSYGLGPYVSFPVATPDGLGPDPWQTGVGGVITWKSETNLASALFHSAWTTSDQSDQAGSMEIQYNLQHFFKNGTQVGLGHPRIEYTWDRDGHGGWSIPVGMDVAKVFHIGRLPVKVMLEYEFIPINDSRWEPEHLVRVTILPVLPGPFREPLFD